MQAFGNPDHSIDLEFPKMEDLASLPLDKKVKLKTVLWKNNSVLLGL